MASTTTSTEKKTSKITFKVVELNKPSASAIENFNKAVAEIIFSKSF